MNINLGRSGSRVMLGAALFFTIFGILSVIPVHAQTTTTTTQGSSSSTSYSMGHGCPNMSNPTGASSNTSTSSTSSTRSG